MAEKMVRLSNCHECENCAGMSCLWDEAQATPEDDPLAPLTRPLRPTSTDSIPDWCPLEDAPRWVPVGEELPPVDEFGCSKNVPVLLDGELEAFGYYYSEDGKTGWCDGSLCSEFEAGRVTHWYKLPLLPAKEASDG